MKTIFVKDRNVNVYTICDLAKAIGVPQQSLWARIDVGAFPAPDFAWRKSKYYSAARFTQLVTAGRAAPVTAPVEKEVAK